MTLLITGASGFLGRAVLAELAQGDWPWQPLGLARQDPGLATDWVSLDLRDRATALTTLTSLAPTAILHLAAEANPGRCEANPELSALLNVAVPETIARYCADRQLPLVFTSTDLVFDGQRAPYREADPVGPLNAYARQKAEAEELVLEAYPKAICCRMPVMFGPGASNFMQTLVAGLQQGRSVSLFVDEFRTPVSGAVAARGLLQAIGWAKDDRHRGLLHLGGTDRLSRYEFGLLLAEVLGYDPSLLQPCFQADMPGLPPRPRDVSLDSGRAYQLGYAPGSIRSQLDRLGLV